MSLPTPLQPSSVHPTTPTPMAQPHPFLQAGDLTIGGGGVLNSSSLLRQAGGHLANGAEQEQQPRPDVRVVRGAAGARDGQDINGADGQAAGEAIGHAVHGNCNLFVSGGSTVVLDVEALEKLEAVRVMEALGGAPRGQRVVAGAVGDGQAAVPVRRMMDDKLESVAHAIVGCCVVVVGTLLGLSIRLASSVGHRTACVALVVAFLFLGPVSLLVILLQEDGTPRERDVSAALFLSLFFWLLVSIGMFTTTSFVHLHPAIPACVGAFLMSALLVYWGLNFSHPRGLNWAIDSCLKKCKCSKAEVAAPGGAPPAAPLAPRAQGGAAELDDEEGHEPLHEGHDARHGEGHGDGHGEGQGELH